MKKLGCAGLSLILFAGLLTGCGADVEADANMVYVKKSGRVISVDVEQLDQPYYDETELESFINTAVDEYNAQNGTDAVKVENLSVEDQTAKLKLEYKTAEDYMEFTGVEIYQGKVVQAMAAGYDFNVEFASVEGGKTAPVPKDEITAHEDLKAVIIKANTDVRVDGKILYVSGSNVTVTGEDTVSISAKADGAAAPEPVDSAEEGTEGTKTGDDTVIVGEVIVGTEEPETVTSLSGDAAGAEEYTYIIYK